MCTRYYPCDVYLACGHVVYGKPYKVDCGDEYCVFVYEDLHSDENVYSFQCDDCWCREFDERYYYDHR